MASRGASSGRKAPRTKVEKAIAEGERDVRTNSVTLSKLPKSLREQIIENLHMSDEMKESIRSGKNNVYDEWTAQLIGVKEKRKVITRFEDGVVTYSVKDKNKFLRRNVSKESAAIEVAKYCLKYLKNG